MKKKRIHEKTKIIAKMKKSTLKYQEKIPLNELFDINWENIQTGAFYDMRIYNFDKNTSQLSYSKLKPFKDNKFIKCKKITLLPTKEQKDKLLDMFEAYRIMYNETNKCIKRLLKNNEKLVSWQKLRTNYLMDTKKDIMKRFNIYSHTLDGAIKLCATSYKVCFTNLKLGHIKYFRIRYLKSTKDSKILDVEKVYFKEKHVFQQYIKDELKNNEDYDYSHIDCDSKIHYNANTDRFTLLVPIELDKINVDKENEYISIDPGIRTFLTGLSEDKVLEIGNNISDKLKEYHSRIDKTNKNKEIKNQKRKKLLKRLREKIKNKMDDSHWKVISYLKKFKNIIIGKWSTKDIISKKSSVLRSMSKRVASSLGYYKFLSRLEYKCKVNGNNLYLVDERYTSKMCSKCGNIKENLGGNKIYNCNECGLKIGRDINSTRNMLTKILV